MQKIEEREEVVEEVTKRRGRRAKKRKKKKLKKVILTLFILIILGIGAFAFLLYGPYPGFREWLITTAMTTMNHQYLAKWFYSDETIAEVMDRNKVVETDEITNTDLIQEEVKTEYANEYERAILEGRDPNHPDYKVIEIEGKGYSGYLAVVYEPSKIKVAVTKKLNVSGQYVVTMAQDHNAQIAINGGGFVDPNYNSTGGIPMGVTIVDGKVITKSAHSGAGGVIGFTEDDKLILGKMTAKEALNKGVRDAVSFGPFLIVNGKPSFIEGNGGWGTAPRTAIGQRQDGIVLMLVIDGRTATKPGIDMVELTNIMMNYGAYNAANLDGGTSSVLVENNKLINDPINSDGKHKTRPIATCFYLAQ